MDSIVGHIPSWALAFLLGAVVSAVGSLLQRKTKTHNRSVQCPHCRRTLGLPRECGWCGRPVDYEIFKDDRP